jgi:hypothetical protein
LPDHVQFLWGSARPCRNLMGISRRQESQEHSERECKGKPDRDVPPRSFRAAIVGILLVTASHGHCSAEREPSGAGAAGEGVRDAARSPTASKATARGIQVGQSMRIGLPAIELPATSALNERKPDPSGTREPSWLGRPKGTPTGSLCCACRIEESLKAPATT